jgi:hypothetical protein
VFLPPGADIETDRAPSKERFGVFATPMSSALVRRGVVATKDWNQV